jgi:hypothetical protein
MNDPNFVSREGERMAKPSANELQKAAEAVDLNGFDYEVTLETSAGPIRLNLDATNAPGTRAQPCRTCREWLSMTPGVSIALFPAS